MASDIFVINKNTEREDPCLKSFIPEMWGTVRHAAKHGQTVQGHHFLSTWEEMGTTGRPDDTCYHSICLHFVCAIKKAVIN